MKEVIFSEEQLHNLNEIGKELFEDEQDPRSTAYIRKLKRPKISVFRIILFYILFPALVLTALIVVLKYLGLSTTTTVVIVAIILLAYIILTTKRMLYVLLESIKDMRPTHYEINVDLSLLVLNI